MRREFLRDGVIYGGATLLTSLSNVILVSVYTRALERPAYGVVEFVMVIQLLIQVVVGLELTQAVARFYGGAQTESERRSYASTGFWFLITAYALVCGTMFLAADHIEAGLLGSAVPPGVLRPATVSIYAGVLFYTVRSQLRWELRPIHYAAASLVVLVLTVGLSAYVLLVLRAGLVGLFAASSVGYGVGTIACLMGLRGTFVRTFDTSKLMSMLRFSLPLTISSLAVVAANYGDRLVIRAALGFDDLGAYAAGAKVAGAISLASAGFQLGAVPLIYRHYRRPETPETLAQLLRLFMGVGLVGVIALAAVSFQLLTFFATPTYAEGWRVVPLLALATVLASGYIFLPGLTLHNMTSRFAAINVVSAALGLVFIGVLTYFYGIVGAAIGTLCGAAVGFSLHGIFNQRVYAIPIEWWRIAVAVGTVVATIAIGWGFGQPGEELALAKVLLFGVSAACVCGVLLKPDDRVAIGRLLAAPFASNRPRIGP